MSWLQVRFNLYATISYHCDCHCHTVICAEGNPPFAERKRSVDNDCDMDGEAKVAKMGGAEGQSVRETEVAPSGAEAETGG